MKIDSKELTEKNLIELGFTNVFANIYAIEIDGKVLKVQKFFDGIKLLTLYENPKSS